jgi:hypothetical protein
MMPDIHPGAILADLDLIHSLKQPYWVNSLQPQLHRPRLEVEHLGQHHSVREQVVRGDLDNRDSVKNLPEEHLDHLALDPRQLDLKRSARQHPRRPKPSERQRPHRHHHLSAVSTLPGPHLDLGNLVSVRNQQQEPEPEGLGHQLLELGRHQLQLSELLYLEPNLRAAHSVPLRQPHLELSVNQPNPLLQDSAEPHHPSLLLAV